MQLHHDRHLKTYIDNLNSILKKYPQLQTLTLEQLICTAGQMSGKDCVAIARNAGGVYNHRFFFNSMCPDGKKAPGGALAVAIDRGFGSLEKTGLLPCTEARAELKKLNGVGDKVANCVVLFGLHQLDAFPVDVWIKRALAENMPEGFEPSSLGKYAGLAQQYMFYHARETASGR